MACLKGFAKQINYCIYRCFDLLLCKVFCFLLEYNELNFAMKKFYFLFFVLMLFTLNLSLAANNCTLFQKTTLGNPLLDEGVIDFNSGMIDSSISACADYSSNNNAYFDLKGFAVNPNLGLISFYSAYNPITDLFENLGLSMKTRLDYKVSMFPTYNNMNQLLGVDFKGYAYSSGHGWLKLNCQKHPDLDFDEDVCDLFAAQGYLDDCSSGFGACLDLNDYDILTKTFGLKGHAFSENLGFIDMTGARIAFDKLNLNYRPKVVDFGSGMKPISNGGKFYGLALKFYLGGVDKTREFYNGGYDFCLRFKNNRKINDQDLTPIEQAQDCDDHTNLYGSDLNNYTQDAFSYDSVKNVFRLKDERKIASLVPAKSDEFKIDAVKTSIMGVENFYPINLSLGFDMPMDFITLPYHIDSFAGCDFNNKFKVLNFNENVDTPLSICSIFTPSALVSNFMVDYLFESNLQSDELSLDIYKKELDEASLETQDVPQNNWVFNGNNFVSDLYFKLNSTFMIPKEISKNKLLFRGTYSFNENARTYNVSRVISSVVDSDRSNYSPLIKGILNDKFFKKIDDNLDFKNIETNQLNYLQAFVNQYRVKFLDQNCDLDNQCFEQVTPQQKVYYVNNLESLNLSQLNELSGNTLVLDGVGLKIDSNFFGDDKIGIVQVDANVYLKTSVTDLNLMLSTDGYLMSYVNNQNLNYLLEEKLADYESSLDESVYNQVYVKGEIRTKNCFGCSLVNPVILPDGNQATTLLDSYKARIWDLSLLRKSPLEFRVRMLVGRPLYNECDGRTTLNTVDFQSLNYDKLCYQNSINGINLLKSQAFDFSELGAQERALNFEYSDLDLPYFSQ